MKTTDELKNEHHGIELMLRVLKTVSKKLGYGERVPAEHLDNILDSTKYAELFEAFEQLERDRIGTGKHEEFHALLNNLQETYLN